MTVSPPDHWESHTHGYPEPTQIENRKNKRKIEKGWVKKMTIYRTRSCGIPLEKEIS